MNSKSESKKIGFLPLLISIGIPLILLELVNLSISNMGEIYEELKKTFLFPSKIVFPVVLIIVYILIGIASYKVYALKYRNIDSSSAMFTYAVQLLLNFFWPFIFFGFRLYGLSFIELIITILFAILTLIRFYKKSNIITMLLFLPYLMCLMYGGVLNYFIWLLNEM